VTTTELRKEQAALIVRLYGLDLEAKAIRERLDRVAHLLAGADIGQREAASAQEAQKEAGDATA
jgi:hypothetical protein